MRSALRDRAGIEFFLPIARWRGFGGRTKVREWSFETFTWAAGLASATQQIGLFMTVHVPLLHPVYAAKALATVDHISHGRAGLNIVCGWNPDGVRHVRRDSRRMTLMDRRPSGSRPSSARMALGAVRFQGQVLPFKGVVSRPASLQVAAPRDHERGLRRAGSRFRGEELRLLVFHLLRRSRMAHGHIADIRQRAANFGREVGIYTVCHVVCRETQDEAEDYYYKYAVAEADHAAVDYHMASKKEFAGSHDKNAFDLYRQRFRGGAGTLSAGRDAGEDRRRHGQDRR